MKPTEADVQWAYPARAQRRRIDGFAKLGCVVTAAGAAVDCRILSETPEGAGFGLAALKLSPRFQFRPETVDGVAVGGAKIIIPFRFELPPDNQPRGPAWLDRLLHRPPPADTPSP